MISFKRPVHGLFLRFMKHALIYAQPMTEQCDVERNAGSLNWVYLKHVYLESSRL